MEPLIQKLTELAEQERWDLILLELENIPRDDWDQDLVGRYVRALNNTGQAARAVEVSLAYEEPYGEDPLWCYRLGYAYLQLKKFEEADSYFCDAEDLGADEQLRGWIQELRDEMERTEKQQPLSGLKPPPNQFQSRNARNKDRCSQPPELPPSTLIWE